ncbi:MAG: ferric reductase-like transmembrane domain-containing protein [Actinobacteria bacterium]|nr:ferric reductase-like transmembrane domain-containing protein [Actinomycetota bacterium]
MDPQLIVWIVARATGVAAYIAVCLSILSGIALRTSVLDFLATNRALRSLHDFMTWIWIPLGLTHVTSLLLDKTAQIGLPDLVVPFRVGYAPLAIGLGTLSLDLIVLITVTSWLRRRTGDRLWRWVHRTSYVAFGTMFLHGLLSGTDFSSPLISAIAWSAALGIGVLAVSRILFGRLPG